MLAEPHITNESADKVSAVQPALIVIPDISGFTRFMNEADLIHSQLKISALLETILNSNHLALKVSEIEGDAVLFYDFNNKNSFHEILCQCRLTIENFIECLEEFRKSDCQCGSCSSLQLLTLKIVVHFGLIGSVKVGNYCKLFGKDLIIAHRLLKAIVPADNYILFTQSFIEQYLHPNGVDHQLLIAKADYIENIGTIEFRYMAVNEPKDVNLKGSCL